MSLEPTDSRSQPVLLLANRYPAPNEPSWLTSELAEEFSARGLDVVVICLDANCKTHRVESSSTVTVHRLPGPRRSAMGLARFGFALRSARKIALARSWSTVVGFSVGMRFLGLLPKIRRMQPDANSTFVLWDFFPDHHRQVGSIPNIGPLVAAGRRLEAQCYSSVDQVAVMSPRNQSFLESLGSGHAPVVEIPPWGPTDVLLRRPTTKVREHLRIVFGGQLEVGRGLEQLIRFAEDHPELTPHVRITVFGSGRLSHTLEATTSEMIDYRGQVDRQSYLDYLCRHADVGLVITTPGVTVPSFPSKSVDYMRTGLPVLAVVEESTDFGDLIAERIKCGVSVVAGNNASLHDAVQELRRLRRTGELDELGANGQKYYQANMTVAVAADRILARPSRTPQES